MSIFSCLKYGIVQPGNVIEKNTLPPDLCEMNCQGKENCHMYHTKRSGTNFVINNCTLYDENVQNNEVIINDPTAITSSWDTMCVKGDFSSSPSIISTDIDRNVLKGPGKPISRLTPRNIAALLLSIFVILSFIVGVVLLVLYLYKRQRQKSMF